MKPMMIVKTGVLTPENIKLLRANDICVVETKYPDALKFVDPIPAASNRTQIESAAIAFSRKVLNPGYWTHNETRVNCTALFVDLLVNGTSLDPKPNQQELEKHIFSEAKADELRRLAREEAKEERDKARAKALLAAPKKSTEAP